MSRSVALLFVLFACSSGDVIGPKARPDAGLLDAATDDARAAQGPFARPFAPPSDPGPGGALVTASGEALSLGGYPFPPAQPNDPAFVDGWEVKFDHVLVTVDKITLSDNPDVSPGDQSSTGGVVAELDGPWAIDLHKDDPSYRDGKGGAGERAAPIAAFTKQTGGAGFKTDGTRYAFGFDVVPATYAGFNVNLGPAALADYDAMVKAGCTVLYAGTATFKGQGCRETELPFSAMPKAVDFKLCFKSPTSYVTAQNPDNDPAKAFPNEEHQRGLAFKSNTSVTGQVTIHTDHPFWDAVVHDSPAHFDMLAARASGADPDAGTPLVTLDQMVGVDFLHFTDAQGRALPWRSCLSTYTPPDRGTMHFDPRSVPQQPPGGDPAQGLRDAYDFMTYDQSTQGHLNSDGLAAVRRRYPSPL